MSRNTTPADREARILSRGILGSTSAAQRAEYNDVAALHARPLVSKVTPSTGLATAGGTDLILNGDRFTDVTAVVISGGPALDPEDWSVISDQVMTVRAPARAAGTHDLYVITPRGGSSAARITYV